MTLLGYYPFQSNGNDSSGLAKHLTPFNTPTFEAGAIGNGMKCVAASLQYQGYSVGDYGISSKANYSFSLFYRPDTAFADFRAILSQFVNVNNYVSLGHGGSGAGSNSGLFAGMANGSNVGGYSAAGVLTLGVTYYIGVSYDGAGSTSADKLKIFLGTRNSPATQLNLTFTGTVAATTANLNAGAMHIGRQAANYANGLIDEVRIYDETLTLAQHRTNAALAWPNIAKSGFGIGIGISL